MPQKTQTCRQEICLVPCHLQNNPWYPWRWRKQGLNISELDKILYFASRDKRTPIEQDEVNCELLWMRGSLGLELLSAGEGQT